MSICRIGMLTIYSIVIGAARGPDESARTPEEWTTPGTQWRLHVKQYRGYGPQLASKNPRDLAKMEEAARSVQDDFEMIVTVLEPKVVDGQLTARLRLTATNGAAREVRENEYVLEIDAKTARVRRLLFGLQQVDTENWIFQDDREHLLFRISATWFPVDWIVKAQDISGGLHEWAREYEMPRPTSQRSATPCFKKMVQPMRIGLASAAATRIEAEVKFDKSFEYKDPVVQVWVPGEYWWRRFERYKDGILNLEAELIPGSLVKP